jgi:tRNA pseudouridine(55) synthase
VILEFFKKLFYKNKFRNGGFLVFNKPRGRSSAFWVRYYKRITQYKVGHFGTLDPAASGLLVIVFGQATKFLQYFKSTRRSYEFVLRFGSETDSGDLEGKILNTCHKRPLKKEIEDVLSQFMGNIEQTPPRFSAIKIKGVRAYKLARDEVEFEMKKRQAYIEQLRLISFNEDEARFFVECSSGFYIRSLGQDIAKALGCIGVLASIERMSHFPFDLKKNKKIFNLNIFLGLYDNLPLTKDQEKRIRNGLEIDFNGQDGLYSAFRKEYFLFKKFLGIVEIKGAVLFSKRMIKH